MPSDYYSSVYIFVLGITLQLMGHLHAMAIHNNAVELARLRVLIHFAIALTHSVNQSCVCSWAVGRGPRNPPPLPRCPEKPLGNVCCQGEKARRKKAGEEEGTREEERAERVEEKSVGRIMQTLSGTFLIMFQQDKSHPVAI